MKIRVFSDIHVDVNEGFPFSLKKDDDAFTLIPGDISGNPKLTAKWVKENIRHGMFIVGNHDPSYNDLGWTVKKAKEYLAERFKPEDDVTFMDEQVGVMSKVIPGTDILVIGSTLYTDYKYVGECLQRCLDDGNSRRVEHGEEPITAEVCNMAAASRGLNDFRWGHVEDEFDDRGLKQRHLRPDDYKKWFDVTFNKIQTLVEDNSDREIIVMTHHCPSPQLIAEEYVGNNMNASYVSDLEGFILKHSNIRAWVCGHVHSVKITNIGERNRWLVCNPRGYERSMESGNWNPNTFIDTDNWTIVTEPYENEKLKAARKKQVDKLIDLAPFIF